MKGATNLPKFTWKTAAKTVGISGKIIIHFWKFCGRNFSTYMQQLILTPCMQETPAAVAVRSTSRCGTCRRCSRCDRDYHTVSSVDREQAVVLGWRRFADNRL